MDLLLHCSLFIPSIATVCSWENSFLISFFPARIFIFCWVYYICWYSSEIPLAMPFEGRNYAEAWLHERYINVLFRQSITVRLKHLQELSVTAPAIAFTRRRRKLCFKSAQNKYETNRTNKIKTSVQRSAVFRFGQIDTKLIFFNSSILYINYIQQLSLDSVLCIFEMEWKIMSIYKQNFWNEKFYQPIGLFNVLFYIL